MSAGHILHAFRLPEIAQLSELYVRTRQGELYLGSGGISASRGSIASFDTYANSFYEAFWVKFTSVRNINLGLEGVGRIICSIYRESALNRTELLSRTRVNLCDGLATIPVELLPLSHGSPGRIFVEIECSGDDVVVRSLSWSTAQAPVSDVSVGVALCTFNREGFLERTLQRLVDAAQSASVSQVVVVNQGEPFASLRLKAIQQHCSALVRVISQDNHGGAGGFTRAIIELMGDASLTHVMLLDDDVEIDATHISRVSAFLSYAIRPMVIGGQMLDLYDRGRVYECGAHVTSANTVKPIHHGQDARSPTALRQLARVVPAHYCGWWLSVFPMSAFHQFGLPLPVFLHGDDREFGVRLAQHGIPTFALPPISVWHEPASGKAPGWPQYYDIRNRLVFASMYPDYCRPDSARGLVKNLVAHLVRYDYQQVAIMKFALRDYCRGPKLLDQYTALRHRELQHAIEPFAPQPADEAYSLQPLEPPPASSLAQRTRLVLNFVRALFGSPSRAHISGERYAAPDAELHYMQLGPSYVLREPGGHYNLRYRYSLRETWRGLISALEAIVVYRVRRRSCSAAWRASRDDLSGLAAWRHRLGLDMSTRSGAELASEPTYHAERAG